MPTLFISLFSVLSLSACASQAKSVSEVPVPAPSVAAASAPRAQENLKPSPGSAISLDASEEVQYPLTAEEKKPLLAKFRKTLLDQEKALDREQKNSTKEFASSQSQQLKDWRNQEKKARQNYFDQHLSGPDRRAYVQSYISRKKEFDQKQKNDQASFKLALKEKRDVFKVTQKNRMSQFQGALDSNIRPPSTLWNQ